MHGRVSYVAPRLVLVKMDRVVEMVCVTPLLQSAHVTPVGKVTDVNCHSASETAQVCCHGNILNQIQYQHLITFWDYIMVNFNTVSFACFFFVFFFLRKHNFLQINCLKTSKLKNIKKTWIIHEVILTCTRNLLSKIKKKIPLKKF